MINRKQENVKPIYRNNETYWNNKQYVEFKSITRRKKRYSGETICFGKIPCGLSPGSHTSPGWGDLYMNRRIECRAKCESPWNLPVCTYRVDFFAPHFPLTLPGSLCYYFFYKEKNWDRFYIIQR